MTDETKQALNIFSPNRVELFNIYVEALLRSKETPLETAIRVLRRAKKVRKARYGNEAKTQD